MTQPSQTPRIVWSVSLNPLLILSALLALAYGAIAPGLYEAGASTYLTALFKVSSIVLLATLALLARSRLLALALIFGGAGDIGLALGEASFMSGALCFLIGHLFYIALFVRAGVGLGAALRSPWRLAAMIAIMTAAIVMTSLLVPRENALFVPLSVYTGVLTLMTLSSFTLPTSRWLAMAGAVLFFISDGFVAANMFHPQTDPGAAYWMSFAGWMIYWAGQAALCMGALGLHKQATSP